MDVTVYIQRKQFAKFVLGIGHSGVWGGRKQLRRFGVYGLAYSHTIDGFLTSATTPNTTAAADMDSPKMARLYAV